MILCWPDDVFGRCVAWGCGRGMFEILRGWLRRVIYQFKYWWQRSEFAYFVVSALYISLIYRY